MIRTPRRLAAVLGALTLTATAGLVGCADDGAQVGNTGSGSGTDSASGTGSASVATATPSP